MSLTSSISGEPGRRQREPGRTKNRAKGWVVSEKGQRKGATCTYKVEQWHVLNNCRSVAEKLEIFIFSKGRIAVSATGGWGVVPSVKDADVLKKTTCQQRVFGTNGVVCWVNEAPTPPDSPRYLVEVAVRGEEAHHPARNELADVGHEPAQLVKLFVRAAAVEGEVERLSRRSSFISDTTGQG